MLSLEPTTDGVWGRSWAAADEAATFGARRSSSGSGFRVGVNRGHSVATITRQRSGLTTVRPLWICPKCGARLVSRNLWHSCGQFTLGALFRGARPGVLALARDYVRMLRSLGDVQVIPQKSRLVCVARVRFGGLYPRKSGFVVSFALRRWVENPRIVKRVDYGPRWRGHFVAVRSQADLDGELRAWLQEAHDTVGVQDDLARPLHRRGDEAAPDERLQPTAARRSKSSRRRRRGGSAR